MTSARLVRSSRNSTFPASCCRSSSTCSLRPTHQTDGSSIPAGLRHPAAKAVVWRRLEHALHAFCMAFSHLCLLRLIGRQVTAEFFRRLHSRLRLFPACCSCFLCCKCDRLCCCSSPQSTKFGPSECVGSVETRNRALGSQERSFTGCFSESDRSLDG